MCWLSKYRNKLLRQIDGKVDKIMTDITRLESVINQLAEAEGAAVTELKDLATQISELEVGNITQDQVDTLTDKAQAAVEALTTATTQTADEHPDPTPTPENPTKPVYTHEGEGTIDTSLWTSSGFVTEGETPESLYYYSTDVEGGDATGAVEGEWVVYTGTAVPAGV